MISLGPKIEVHPDFPNRTNVQFVHILGAHTIRQRVWERGAGLTAASGSGACAGGCCGHGKGRLRSSAQCKWTGPIRITWREEDGHVLMHGPHALAFEGTLDL